jgi:diguanylate cyclase (GGDEF)-like protein
MYLKHEGVQIFVSVLMIIFGIVLAVFCLTYSKKTGYEKNLKWLAVFAIFRGLWTLIESNVYSFFLARLLIISQLSYLALKVSITAFLEFVNVSFHNGKNRVIDFLIYASYFDFWFSIICQYVFGIDFAYTVIITHIIMLVGGIYACASSFSVFKNIDSYTLGSNVNVSVGFKKISNGAHVVCSMAIIIASIIDLVRYYFFHSPDIARFSRLGDLIYLTVISVLISINFVNLLKMGHNAAIIKEEASTDPMTKILNRSSFERDIVAGGRKQWENKGVAILDLNNLKHFNDTHGHSMGDYYIIISSEIISDAFAGQGTVYRIGGDEFCVITNNISMNDFVRIRTHIEEHMASLKLSSPDLHMEVSAGYAEFNANLDHNLRDTMKRADELMYQRKMQLKNHSD